MRRRYGVRKKHLQVENLTKNTVRKKVGRKRIKRKVWDFSGTITLDDKIVKTVTYAPNTKILCKDRNGLYYDAKVLRIEALPDGSLLYIIHYMGWSSRFDIRLQEADLQDRILPYTKKNLKMAQKWKEIASESHLKRKEYRCRNVKNRKLSSRTRSKRSSNYNETKEEQLRKPNKEYEIELDLPKELERLLIYDRDKILVERFLTRIPARYSVEDILNEYLDHLREFNNRRDIIENYHFDDELELAEECIRGIKEYFNNYLWSQLLYNSERVNFLDFLQQQAKAFGLHKSNAFLLCNDVQALNEFAAMMNYEPANTYGYIHLLRLFCKFASFLRIADWGVASTETVQTAVAQLEKVIRFLDYSCEKYFDCDLDYVDLSDDE